MKKGTFAALFAATIAFTGSTAFALAPVLGNLPNLSVGDLEDNSFTDNNFFVFTNAFRFDDYVADGDTPDASLQWSFDEGDPASQWYQVNGKDPVHTGNTAMAADGTLGTAGSAAAHNPPAGANELRSVSEFASFRDIVFSPNAGTMPFPDPSEDHSAGKLVRFFVSDGTNYDWDDINVESIDDIEPGDEVFTGGCQFVQVDSDQLSASSVHWFESDELAGFVDMDHNTTVDTSGAYRIRIYTTGTISGGNLSGYATQYRNSAFYVLPQSDAARATEWLPYGAIKSGAGAGDENIARLKFHLSAYPATGSYSARNQIPTFRVRAGMWFAQTAYQEVHSYYPSGAQVGLQPVMDQITPSTSAGTPSVYRLDLDPVDVPFLSTSTNGQGVMPGFEVLSYYPGHHGYIALTELEMGVYPKSLLTSAPSRTYQAGTGTHFGIYNEGFSGAFNYRFTSLQKGAWPIEETSVPGELATISITQATGVTISTANVPATKTGGGVVTPEVIGAAIVELDPDGTNSDNLATRLRVERDKQYRFRYHVTSTQQSNRQPVIYFKARALSFAWVGGMEVGGAYSTGSDGTTENNRLAAQLLPGVGTLNPDKISTENGGYYNHIMHSPINSEIQANQSAVEAMAGPGANLLSDRDINIGIDVYDTFSFTPVRNLEVGHVVLDKVDVYIDTLVCD